MSFSMPIQRYHSHADPIWPDGTFKHQYTRAITTNYSVQNYVQGQSLKSKVLFYTLVLVSE